MKRKRYRREKLTARSFVRPIRIRKSLINSKLYVTMIKSLLCITNKLIIMEKIFKKISISIVTNDVDHVYALYV